MRPNVAPAVHRPRSAPEAVRRPIVMPHSLPLRLRATSRLVRSSATPLAAMALTTLTLLSTSARAQATQPVAECLGTFAATLVQGGMAPCTLHVEATELPLAHGRPLTA